MKSRAVAATILGAVISVGFVAPAFGAADRNAGSGTVYSLSTMRNMSNFTPASADPKLAAMLARKSVGSANFRFTPAEANELGNRSVTVAVRTGSSFVAPVATQVVPVESAPGAIGLNPIAYTLGVSVGWNRFALPTDVAKPNSSNRVGGVDSFDLATTYNGKRGTAQGKAVALDRVTGGAPKLVADDPLDVNQGADSFSLSRSFALTAGQRFKPESNRLDRLGDNRRDSQAVYVGTAIRF